MFDGLEGHLEIDAWPFGGTTTVEAYVRYGSPHYRTWRSIYVLRMKTPPTPRAP